MTTDIRVANAPDLSVENDVINLAGISLPEDKILAGICWLIVGCSAFEALKSVVAFVYGLIGARFSGYKVWLLVGNSAWQPDTRIIRYRKLWGALAARGITVMHSCNTQEVMHEEDSKLKFFGATQLTDLSVESVVKVLLEEHCSYLAVLPKTVGPENIINIGWSGNFTDDSQLISVLIGNDGLLIKRSGEFDDEEKGVVGVGQPALVNILAN